MGQTERHRRASAMSTLPAVARQELDRVQRNALVVGGVSLVGCVIGAFFSPVQFFRAYLAVYLFIWGLGLGGFGILMIYFLTGGAWGFLIRRSLEAMTRTLPLLAVLFMPIALGIGYLYPWVRADEHAAGQPLHFNDIYLNAGFFWARAVLFFIAWIGVASILNSWSRRQDVAGDPVLPRKFRMVSAPGLIVYGLCLTFAS